MYHFCLVYLIPFSLGIHYSTTIGTHLLHDFPRRHSLVSISSKPEGSSPTYRCICSPVELMTNEQRGFWSHLSGESNCNTVTVWLPRTSNAVEVASGPRIQRFNRNQKAGLWFASHTLPGLASTMATTHQSFISILMAAPLSENKRNFMYLIGIWIWYFFSENYLIKIISEY